MQNKKLIIKTGITIVAIIAIVFLIQLVNRRAEEEVIQEPFAEIMRAHLFRAGTDYKIGRRNEGQAVIEFQKGDYFGISARVEIEEKVAISAEILDENKIVLNENPMSLLEKMESGSFGLCCGLVPDEEGNYVLRLKAGSAEKEIPFVVMSSVENE